MRAVKACGVAIIMVLGILLEAAQLGARLSPPGAEARPPF